jgi:hypothetical protein
VTNSSRWSNRGRGRGSDGIGIECSGIRIVGHAHSGTESKCRFGGRSGRWCFQSRGITHSRERKKLRTGRRFRNGLGERCNRLGSSKIGRDGNDGSRVADVSFVIESNVHETVRIEIDSRGGRPCRSSRNITTRTDRPPRSSSN